MRVPGTEQPQGQPDEPRPAFRRAVIWALIGAAVVVGVLLYFRYERVLAPLVSSQGS